MTQVLVVLPTFNERDNVAAVLTAVREALPEGHALVVDDGSPDGTADAVRAVSPIVGNVRLVHGHLRVIETPIVFRDRRYGSSKMSWRIVAESMWLVTIWGVRDLVGRGRPQRRRTSSRSRDQR